MHIFVSEKIKRNFRGEAGEGDWGGGRDGEGRGAEEERGGGEKPERHGWWYSK